MILFIMGYSLIGTVFLIRLFSSLPPRDGKPSVVVEKPFRNLRYFNGNLSGSVSSEKTGDDTKKATIRDWIARRSVLILRSRGMSDKEIKSELQRDFAIKEEEVDRILAEK